MLAAARFTTMQLSRTIEPITGSRRLLARIIPPNLSILLTAATAYQLWPGLVSQRIIPEIRRQVLADPDFTALVHKSADDEVEFQVFRIEPARP